MKKKLSSLFLTAVLVFGLVPFNTLDVSAADLLLPSDVILTENNAQEDEISVRKRFDDYTDKYFKDVITSNTINLHYTLAYPENYGLSDYTPSLGHFSVQYINEDNANLMKMQEFLSGIDPELLTGQQRLTYRLLFDYTENELSVADYPLYNELLSSAGYQAELPVLLAEYTFRTRRDIEDYLSLLTRVDDIFSEIIEFEKEKSAAGLFMADFTADAVIEQCEEFISNPESNYLIDIFNSKIDDFPGLTPDEKSGYIEKNRELVTTEIVSAYKLLIDGLEALKGTGKNEAGLYYYEHGRDFYEYLVRSGTGSASSVESLKRQTEEFIYETLMPFVYYDSFTGLPSFDAIKDYGFPFTEPEDILEDLTEKIRKDFPAPPEVNYTVKYVHPSMEEHMSPAFYLTPPVDDYKNNVIYINKSLTDENIYPTIAHEGYPGHLYQTVYSASRSLPLIRNILQYPGYIEGWATYAEFQSYGMSGIDKVMADFLRADNEVSLALYTYIDIGIHYEGWTREDVADYLSVFGITSSETADLIFEVIVEEPALYLNYFIGYLEILKLREDAEILLGESFSPKEFHRFLLDTGPAPFYIIRDEMYGWISEQKGITPENGGGIIYVMEWFFTIGEELAQWL